MGEPAESDRGVVVARNLMVSAAAAVAVGVLIAGTASQMLGGVVVLGGWLAFVYALHRFGRAGSAVDK